MLRPRARNIALIAIGLVAAAGLFFWHKSAAARAAAPAYGVTFSTLYAQELGLDWKAAYLATLDDLGIRHFRIPVYWRAEEKTQGVYDWSDVDWMLEEAAKRELKEIQKKRNTF